MANYVFFGLFAIVIAGFIAFFAQKLVEYKNEGFVNLTEIGHIILYITLSVLALTVVVALNFKK